MMNDRSYIKNRAIHNVAVLGAGVMGAQIATHFINAGLNVILFDLPSEGKDPCALVNASISKLKKQKPSPAALASHLNLIQVANYRDDLDKLSKCDLIIEAIAERRDWKVDLYHKVAPFLNQNAILASNTSSISIAHLAEALPDDLKSRFLGIHFFNPPRYMYLVEVIAHASTNATILDQLESVITTYLGKGVIRAKDTPGFIGNRIGVMAMLIVLHHANRFNLPLDLVDELTGIRIGRPKSATFRTMDLVGLDTMGFVVNELRENLPEDPWHGYIKLPDWLQNLINQGALGVKSKKGIYKKIEQSDKEGEIHVYEPEKNEYRLSLGAQINSKLKEILKLKANERFNALIASDHPQAKFLVSVYCDLFHYCACHLETISENARDLDLALRWGYGWEQGPFEIWQSFGWQSVVDYLISTHQPMVDCKLPDWVTDPKRNFVHDQDSSWSPSHNLMQPRSTHPVYLRQMLPASIIGYQEKGIKEQKTVHYEDKYIIYWSLEKAVGIISFKTKLNTISYGVIQGLETVLDMAYKKHNALIIYQESQPFCAGANLYEVLMGAKLNHFENNGNVFDKIKQKSFELFTQLPPLPDDLPPLTEVISRLQSLFMEFKHSNMPMIAAVNGLALGGGCELLLHCDRVVATHESYIGLVEAGVGILPSGAGTKEMTVRAYEQSLKMGNNANLLSILSQYFEQIAMGKVSTSALEAKTMGYLREQDSIVMNSSELLYVAHQHARLLIASGYYPPRRDIPVKVMGHSGQATLGVFVSNLLAGGYISKHDQKIAMAIADTMTGGTVADNTLVSHQWLLDLEKQHFLGLLKTKLTQDRVEYMLTKGKPLRN